VLSATSSFKKSRSSSTKPVTALLPARFHAASDTDLGYWQDEEVVICDPSFLVAVKTAMFNVVTLGPMVKTMFVNQPVMIRRSQISQGWDAPASMQIHYMRKIITNVWKTAVNDGSIKRGNVDFYYHLLPI
jgi:hypothetical protein